MQLHYISFYFAWYGMVLSCILRYCMVLPYILWYSTVLSIKIAAQHQELHNCRRGRGLELGLHRHYHPHHHHLHQRLPLRKNCLIIRIGIIIKMVPFSSLLELGGGVWCKMSKNDAILNSDLSHSGSDSDSF